MSYAEFKVEYVKLFKLMMSYTLEEAGSIIYACQMADLADAYPEFADRCENEAE